MKRTIQLAAFALGAFIAGATLGHAQATRVTPFKTPTVLSGSDVGFRVEAAQGTAVVGTLVVRVNGQWIDAQNREPAAKRLAAQ